MMRVQLKIMSIRTSENVLEYFC